jgi:hypothetical protein
MLKRAPARGAPTKKLIVGIPLAGILAVSSYP